MSLFWPRNDPGKAWLRLPKDTPLIRTRSDTGMQHLCHENALPSREEIGKRVDISFRWPQYGVPLPIVEPS